MEAAGIVQEILRVVTPQFTGRPRFVTAAIRRSVAVGIVGARCMGLRNLAPVAGFLGSVAITVALSRALLENRGLTEEQIGAAPSLGLQIQCSIGLIAAMSPVLRKLRMII
jgi:hypothetical protein